jgi:hypothetical protein
VLGFVSGSSILVHWCMCQFLCKYHAAFVTVVLKYNLKSDFVTPPELLFLLRIAFDIWGLLFFHMNFRIQKNFYEE